MLESFCVCVCGAMENVSEIHKQTLSKGNNRVFRNVVPSFTYSKGFVESLLLSAGHLSKHWDYLMGLTVRTG